uniref:Sushi domain-containing protein n=1 Tax=Podarcis muralis TaxID=64176 RepID=A0A670I9T4_PODMU
MKLLLSFLSCAYYFLCAPPPSLQFAELLNEYKENNSFPVGSVVKYMCRPGYAKHPGLKASLMCIRNQEWSGVQEFCKISQCPLPLDIPNGNHNGFPGEVFTSQKSVTYSCDPGYSLVGKASISCTASGEWSSPLPRCEKIHCPSPPKVQHGKYRALGLEQYTSGKIVKYSCDPGYVLIGRATIYCTASGVWSLPVPRCECKYSATLDFHLGFSTSYFIFSFAVTGCVSPKIQNGRITRSKGQVKPTETITFECDPGYILKGNHTIQCQFDSTWDSPTPICVRGRY